MGDHSPTYVQTHMYVYICIYIYLYNICNVTICKLEPALTHAGRSEGDSAETCLPGFTWASHGKNVVELSCTLRPKKTPQKNELPQAGLNSQKPESLKRFQDGGFRSRFPDGLHGSGRSWPSDFEADLTFLASTLGTISGRSAADGC